MHFDYADSGYEVRENLIQAHRDAWDIIAHPVIGGAPRIGWPSHKKPATRGAANSVQSAKPRFPPLP